MPGSYAAELRQTWVERKQECCKKRNKRWGHRSRYALLRQRARPRRLGLAPGTASAGKPRSRPSRSDATTMLRGCPHAELKPNEPALRSGAAGFEWPAWGTREFLSAEKTLGFGQATATTISCLASLAAETPSLKSCRAVNQAASRRSMATPKRRKNSSQFEGTYLDIRVHLAVRLELFTMSRSRRSPAPAAPAPAAPAALLANDQSTCWSRCRDSIRASRECRPGHVRRLARP